MCSLSTAAFNLSSIELYFAFRSSFSRHSLWKLSLALFNSCLSAFTASELDSWSDSLELEINSKLSWSFLLWAASITSFFVRSIISCSFSWTFSLRAAFSSFSVWIKLFAFSLRFFLSSCSFATVSCHFFISSLSVSLSSLIRVFSWKAYTG